MSSHTDHMSEVIHMITIIVPHIVILVTTILNFWQSRRNAKRIKHIESALNGKAEDERKE